MKRTGLLVPFLCPSLSFSTNSTAYAGHSKWQNIKYRKTRQDATRSSQNTRIANMIYIAAKEGGSPDPQLNVRLATMIENASKMSVPKKVIEGAVQRAVKASGNPAENAQNIAYEGVGPGGVAFIVEALTENKNRTAQQVRALFLKYQGSLNPTKFLFTRRGWIDLADKPSYDEALDKCLDIPGLEDIEEDEGFITLYTQSSLLGAVANEVKTLYKISDMGLAFFPDPDQSISVKEGSELYGKVKKLIDELHHLDDVNNVYHNALL